MKFSKFNVLLFCVVVGFFLIALDVNVNTGLNYPNKYVNSKDVIGEFQYYTIHSNYNATCTYKMIDDESHTSNTSGDPAEIKVIDKVSFSSIYVDILSDFVGFLLIFIAALAFRKSSKKFSYGAICAFCGIILHVIIFLLPFFTNNLILCNTALVLGLAYMLCIIFTTFMMVSGLLTMCPDVCCRDERKWSKMAWFVSAVLQILVIFILWLGSDFKALYNIGIFLEITMGIFILIFWMILKRTKNYIEKSYYASLNNNDN